MKKYIVLLWLVPFLWSSSCKKDDLGISRKIMGLLNGQQWEAEGKFAFNLPHNIGIDLLFDVYNDAGERREALLVYKVPFKEGSYKISVTTNQINEEVTGAVYRTFSHDGDVIDDTYRLYDPADNTVKITEADTQQNIVKGEVNATFLVDPSDQADAAVDTIRVKNAVFEIPLRN